VRRPKLPTPNRRMIACTAVIFCKAPVSRLPGFEDEFEAALKASHAGVDRHRDRDAGNDWQSVYDLILATAVDRDVFTAPIKAARVHATLDALEQTHAVMLARGDEYYPAFIKWVRRGLKSKKLRPPHPLDM
jgi:hypothetical protein